MLKKQTRVRHSLNVTAQAWLEALHEATGMPRSRVLEWAIADLGDRLGITITGDAVAAMRAHRRARAGIVARTEWERLRARGWML